MSRLRAVPALTRVNDLAKECRHNGTGFRIGKKGRTMTETAFLLGRVRTRRACHDTRYEYRIWPGTPHPAVAMLHRLWLLTQAERRDDIYLMHAASHRLLIKLRAGRRLEIKRRHRDVGNVQNWSTPVSVGFPLGARSRADLSRALGLYKGLARAAGLSPAHLLAALGASEEAVAPQTVCKSRLLFETGGCRAEICRVSVAGWRGMTIALESGDLAALVGALDDLRLGGLPNRSYGEALARLGLLRMRRDGPPTALTPKERTPG